MKTELSAMRYIKTISLFLLLTLLFSAPAFAAEDEGWTAMPFDEEFIDLAFLPQEQPSGGRLLRAMRGDIADETNETQVEAYEELKALLVAELQAYFYHQDIADNGKEPSYLSNLPFRNTVKDGLTFHEVWQIYYNALYDAPEATFFAQTGGYLEWLYWDDVIDTYQIDGEEYPIFKKDALLAIAPNFVCEPEATETFQSAVDAACVECFGASEAEQIQQNGMSDLEKVVVAHGWIAANCIYDPYVGFGKTDGGFGPDPAVYTAYGVFANRKAVCQGYALALKVLLDRAGIDCVFVDSAPLDHAWNLVRLNGDWYHIDTTWDDPGTKFSTCDGSVRYWNFLLSDRGIIGTGHIPENWDISKQGNPWSTEFDLAVAPKSMEIPDILSASETPVTLYEDELYLVSGTTLCAFTRGSDFANPVETNLNMANYAVASAFDAENGVLYLISEPAFNWFENDITVDKTGVGTQIVYRVPLENPTAVRVSAIDNNTLKITDTKEEHGEILYSFRYSPYGIRCSKGKLYTTYNYNSVGLRAETYLEGSNGFRLYYPADLSTNTLGGSRFDLFIDDGVSAQISLAYYAESGRMLGFETLPVNERGICALDDNYTLPRGTAFVKLFSVESSEGNYMVPLAETIRIAK